MKAFVAVSFACLVVYAKAVPSGIWGIHGHGHLPVVGASGVVSSGGAAGPAGIVNGHGAVGPNGIPNAVHGHAGVLGVGLGGIGLGGLGLGGVGLGGLAGHGWDGDDGQWHGEGLLASQDLAGHGIVGHGLGLGLGLGHGGHW